MPETIQFPIEKIKYKTQEENNLYNVYLQEYNISILIKYQLKEDKKENQREKTESELESLLEQIKENFKEKIQEQNERHQNKDIKIISLEEKLRENENKEKYILPHKYKGSNQNNNLNGYFQYLASQNTNHHINQKSGAHVFYVPSSYLPPNVLGMYVPSMHTIYIANDLPEKDREFVYFHEEYHSIHGAGEEEADNYAFQRTGYNLRAA